MQAVWIVRHAKYGTNTHFVTVKCPALSQYVCAEPVLLAKGPPEPGALGAKAFFGVSYGSGRF